MVAVVALTAWGFDAGGTAEPMLAAVANNNTTDTIPIARRGVNRITGRRMGDCCGPAGVSVHRVSRVTHQATPRRCE